MNRFLFRLVFSVFLCLGAHGSVAWNLSAQTETLPLDASPENLQNIDWDEEESETAPENLQNIDWDEEESETAPENLQNIDWDEEESEAETAAPSVFPTIDETELERQILRTHWTGSFLFLFYTFGAFLTAYLLRNTGIASRFPPDLLILLHVLWPLEWLLVPFFKKPPGRFAPKT